MDGDGVLSFNVLVVPEDPQNNGYILKPLVSRILSACGKPNAKVTVLTNPRAKGYEHAKALLRDLFERYRQMDLFLFLPDADGKDRSAELRVLEKLARDRGAKLLCCAAEQEIEVWLLAGHRDRLKAAPWQEIRADVSVKENVFHPFLAEHGNSKAPGGGRQDLMNQALNGYGALLQLCPELAELERRVREIVG